MLLCLQLGKVSKHKFGAAGNFSNSTPSAYPMWGRKRRESHYQTLALGLKCRYLAPKVLEIRFVLIWWDCRVRLSVLWQRSRRRSVANFMISLAVAEAMTWKVRGKTGVRTQFAQIVIFYGKVLRKRIRLFTVHPGCFIECVWYLLLIYYIRVL